MVEAEACVKGMDDVGVALYTVECFELVLGHPTDGKHAVDLAGDGVVSAFSSRRSDFVGVGLSVHVGSERLVVPTNEVVHFVDIGASVGRRRR